MFGGFQNGWPAGLTQFSDLSDRALSLRKQVEAGLQDSGLLGPGEVPTRTADDVEGISQAIPLVLTSKKTKTNGTIAALGDAARCVKLYFKFPQLTFSLFCVPT